MHKLRHISFVILLAALSVLGACSKSFEDYNTLISIVLPDNCDDCNFNILDPDDYHSWLSASINGKNQEIVTVEIDWEVTTWIDPGTEPLLLGIRKYHSDTFGSQHLTWYELLYSQESEIKPGKSYEWDPLEGTLKSDGKTEKKVRQSSSGNGNTSTGNSDCEDDPVAKKYKDRINAPGGGCQPCATCAALACAKYIGDPELIKNYTAAVKQEEAYYETKTCPELY